MDKKLKFLLSYFIFWIILFVSAKFLFLIYYWKKTFSLDLTTIPGIFYHGAKLDLSAIGYVFILPVTVLFVTSFFPGKICYYILKGYNYLLLIAAPFLMISDLILYKYWGFRLDNTPLLYIKNPGEMIASVSTGIVLAGILTSLVISYAIIYLYNRFSGLYLKNLPVSSLSTKVILVMLIPFLALPVRGGFNTSPVNLSTAYFSSDNFANHAAINLYWNIGYSFTNSETRKNPYNFYHTDSVQTNFRKLMEQSNSRADLLNSNRPDIILIIIESFTSKFIEPLGGVPELTPRFNRLTREGIFFTNLYANGDRSDKGIVALLSGFPALGKTSIMKFPEKVEKLPNMAGELKDSGYHLSFYYGGDIEFFNLKSYLISAGYRYIISERAFASDKKFSKWGVPDEFVFDKLYNDICNATDTPFFKSMFTLSNHEPYDIPASPKFPGNNIEDKFYSSAFYTDSCLGNFIDKLKLTDHWDNTIVILVADHGSRLPEESAASAFQNFSIPMLWVGGAIKKDTIIRRYGMQVDLPKTLLNQLGMKVDQYPYSKDLFSADGSGFAEYAFNDGFGFLTDSIRYVYDHNADKITTVKGNPGDKLIRYGKSFLQATYEDFLNR